MKLLRFLWPADLNRAGQTIVMVTHNLAMARRATRLLFMHDGCLEERDPREIATVDR